MNAFDLLLKRGPAQDSSHSSKKKPRGTEKSPHGSQRNYEVCPICQRSIPASFANSHAASCMGYESIGPAAAHLAAAALHGQAANEQAKEAISEKTSVHGTAARQETTFQVDISVTTRPQDKPCMVAQPQQQQDGAHEKKSILKGSEVLPMDIACEHAASCPPVMHISSCDISQQLPTQGIASLHGRQDHVEVLTPAVHAIPISAMHVAPVDTPASDHQKTHASDTVVSQKEPCQDADAMQPCSMSSQGSKNAFSMLMNAQRQQSRAVQTFHLERSGDGTWRWLWWQKGAQAATQQQGQQGQQHLPCAWSATTSVSAARGNGGSTTTVLLQTNVPPGEGGSISWDNLVPSQASTSQTVPGGGGGVGGSKQWRGGLSALKSALQKCIRLGRGPGAVRCALHLMKEDPSELLRRLSIICLEDAVLHPSLPFLTWLMAAHAKGYTMGAAVCSEVLRITYQLARVAVKDYLPPPTMRPGRSLQHLGEADQGLSPEEAALVKCMLLRASFGGMAGDVAMLRGYAGLWAARFRQEAEPAPPVPACCSQQQQQQAAVDTGEKQRAESGELRQLSAPAPFLSESAGAPLPRSNATAPGAIAAASTAALTQSDSAVAQQQSNPNPACSTACLSVGTAEETACNARSVSKAADAYCSLYLGSSMRDNTRTTEDASVPTVVMPSMAGFIPASQLVCCMEQEQNALQLSLHHGRQAVGTQLAPAVEGCPAAQAAGREAAAAAADSWLLQQHLAVAQGVHTEEAGMQIDLNKVDLNRRCSSQLPGKMSSWPAAAGVLGSVDVGSPEGKMSCWAAAADVPGPVETGVPGAAHAAEVTGSQPQQQCSMAVSSPWLAYLHTLYYFAVPPELTSPTSVGPLRLSDIPLSAVDFHVSDVVPHLLSLPPVHAAAVQLTQGSWGPDGDPEACLRSAMWLFRSGLNSKRWLCDLYMMPHGSQPGGKSQDAQPAGHAAGASHAALQLSSDSHATDCTGVRVPYEHVDHLADLERDNAQRERLKPLWEVAAPHADSFSREYIRRRFQQKLST